MKTGRTVLITVGVLVFLFLLMGPFYVLEEGELSVVTRFGKIIKTEEIAGLKFKMPFVDSVNKYPKKIQSWDGESQRLPTEENQFIWVDTTARWRIVDLKLFYESVGTINQAQSRLDDVIGSGVRKIIARNSLREAIRNSNVINEIERRNVFQNASGLDEEGEATRDISVIASTFTDVKYEGIQVGREELSNRILKEAQTITPTYGIKLIDIIIRQIKYSDDLTQSVYNRMIKERNQIAQAFRSDGEGERALWMGKKDRELRTIRSKAEREAKEIKAKADQEALEIRNRAYSRDAEFAEFWIAMQSYQEMLPRMRKVLSTDFEFFKYLYRKQP
ncbi:MAG TPA: protease modulator HflC [Candidatus Aminicenantes bacterium]|nr:protease modulator HflC [Candidatus Aminicenantes bacterium]